MLEVFIPNGEDDETDGMPNFLSVKTFYLQLERHRLSFLIIK